MSDAARALVGGVLNTIRAPLLLLVVIAFTLAAALPFAWVVGSRLQAALADQPAINLDAEEIDAEWWIEFREQASGLDATFTPTIIGFAAPLDNWSALLDGTRRPLALLSPVVVYGLLWAFLWGGVIRRFSVGRGTTSARDFLRAGVRHFPQFAIVSAAAAMVCVVLYATVHRVLFGPLYDWLASGAGSERDAFVARVVLYAVFGALLALVMLMADYTRVASVVVRCSLWDAVRTATGFMRTNASAVAALYVLSALTFALVLGAYGVADRRGGGWRAVALGQAFIAARLAMRLACAASQVSLFQRRAAFAQATSRGPEYDGPPAPT